MDSIAGSKELALTFNVAGDEFLFVSSTFTRKSMLSQPIPSFSEEIIMKN